MIDLQFDLPQELIAQIPTDRRDAARLMAVRLGLNKVEDRWISDLPRLLQPGDLMVLNDTRVIPARFYGVREKTGGRVEGLYLTLSGESRWHVMLQSGGRLLEEEAVRLDADHRLILIEKQDDGSWIARLEGPLDVHALLDKIGVMPLPPYIRRDGDAQAHLGAMDRARYQTVYAEAPGAIAAPTAGLHFTPQLLEALERSGVETTRLTLHVGAGTFAPVRSETLDGHTMHREWFSVGPSAIAALTRARREGRRIIPVGTTCVRALESLPDPLPPEGYTGQTSLLIQPGFAFRFTDGLMTNFHLPRSTLLALVAALVGLDRLMALYRRAGERRYRFFSYGDAMLILP